jgi:hypothetical protein
MLQDLLLMAGSDTVGASARRTVVEIYGSEALPSVDAALADETDPPQAARLRQLRAAILAAAAPE